MLKISHSPLEYDDVLSDAHFELKKLQNDDWQTVDWDVINHLIECAEVMGIDAQSLDDLAYCAAVGQEDKATELAPFCIPLLRLIADATRCQQILRRELSQKDIKRPDRVDECCHALMVWLNLEQQRRQYRIPGRGEFDIRSPLAFCAEAAKARGVKFEFADYVADPLPTLKRLMDVLEVEAATKPFKKQPLTKERREALARKYLEANPNITVKELSKKIGCAEGLIPSLPPWRAVQDEKKKGRTPRAVSMTAQLHDSLKDQTETVEFLAAEQVREMREDERRMGAPRRAKLLHGRSHSRS